MLTKTPFLDRLVKIQFPSEWAYFVSQIWSWCPPVVAIQEEPSCLWVTDADLLRWVWIIKLGSHLNVAWNVCEIPATHILNLKENTTVPGYKNKNKAHTHKQKIEVVYFLQHWAWGVGKSYRHLKAIKTVSLVHITKLTMCSHIGSIVYFLIDAFENLGWPM